MVRRRLSGCAGEFAVGGRGLCQNAVDGGDEIKHGKGLPEHQPTNAANEEVPFGISTVTTNEDKPPAETRFDAFDGEVKHVARQGGHDKVAENNVKISAHDPPEAVGARTNAGDAEAVRAEESAEQASELGVVVQQQDCLGSIGDVNSI